MDPVMKTDYKEVWDWRVENENKPIWTRNPKVRHMCDTHTHAHVHMHARARAARSLATVFYTRPYIHTHALASRRYP